MAALSQRRLRAREEKTTAILDAAMALVERDGVEGLTIQKLARRLDRAVGALYRYFPSKDALFVGLQRRVVGAYGVALRDALAALQREDPDLGPIGGLLAAAKLYQRWFLSRRSHLALVSIALADPRYLLPADEGQRVLEAALPLLQQVGELFDQAARGGLLAEGDLSARTLVFWATLQGVVQLNKMARYAPDALNNDRLLRQATTTLLAGWGADASSLPGLSERTEQWIIQRTRP